MSDKADTASSAGTVPGRRSGPATGDGTGRAADDGTRSAASGHTGPAAGSGSGALGPTDSVASGARQSDAQAVSRFNEEYAFALGQMGFPRMPARVLVALFTADAGRLTAAELADSLQASPAAVSGAVRYLTHIGVIRREGEPGTRRHYYRVPDDWLEESLRLRDSLMGRWAALVRDGIGIFGADTPTGARLAETAEFLEFVSVELPRVISKWQQNKAEPHGRATPAPKSPAGR